VRGSLPAGSPPPRVIVATLDVLDVFVADASNDLHGFTLARRTRRPAGTIYPVLMGLEESGLAGQPAG
jgi:DNA-binding IclR family transcriptional regulator